MGESEKTSPERGSDRRRRSRVRGATQGWIIPETGESSDPWEVRVVDVNRHGVGFESCEKLSSGEVCRIRIGRGPLGLAKRIRVVRCNPGSSGTFTIGGEFV
jgi:hypothetical protein